MIIDESEKCWELEVTADNEFFYLSDELGIDEQQARQLIQVLQHWIDGGDVI